MPLTSNPDKRLSITQAQAWYQRQQEADPWGVGTGQPLPLSLRSSAFSSPFFSIYALSNFTFDYVLPSSGLTSNYFSLYIFILRIGGFFSECPSMTFVSLPSLVFLLSHHSLLSLSFCLLCLTVLMVIWCLVSNEQLSPPHQPRPTLRVELSSIFLLYQLSFDETGFSIFAVSHTSLSMSSSLSSS